jgi:hypothetical protein
MVVSELGRISARHLLVAEQLAERGFMLFVLRFFPCYKTGWFGTANAFSCHLANDPGGGENLFLGLARHGIMFRIFAHIPAKNAII